MTVYEPEWDDETPEADPVVSPVMAEPAVIVLGVTYDPDEPDWAKDNAPGWTSL